MPAVLLALGVDLALARAERRLVPPHPRAHDNRS